jgi:octaprenyl-diphosphate synthase
MSGDLAIKLVCTRGRSKRAARSVVSFRATVHCTLRRYNSLMYVEQHDTRGRVAAPFQNSDLVTVVTPLAERVRTSLAAEFALLDHKLRTSLESDVALVRSISEYIVTGGGKRLRPLLVFLSAKALGADTKSELVIDLAATVELIHTATLLHDDVVDESALRRGRATANAEFGNAASVLVGDFLYSRAFQVMVGTGKMHVLALLSEATNRIAEGEVMQLMALGNLSLTEADYMRVIEAKTAKLFEAAGALGAIAAGAPAATERALAEYARRLGVAFQIADDVLDYRGDVNTLGKSLGDDLAEGKLTLPIIITLERGSDAGKALLRSVLAQAHAVTPTQFRDVMAALEACGALDESLARAESEAAAATEEIAFLPESDAKKWMLELCAYAVRRNA